MQAPRLQSDLGLVMHQELLLLNRGSQIVFKAYPVAGKSPTGCLPIKEAKCIAALGCGKLCGQT